MTLRLLKSTAILLLLIYAGVGCGGDSGGGSGNNNAPVKISDISISPSNVSRTVIQGDCSQEYFEAPSDETVEESSNEDSTSEESEYKKKPSIPYGGLLFENEFEALELLTLSGGGLSVSIGPTGGGNSISTLISCIDGAWATEPLDLTRFHQTTSLSITVTPISNSGERGDPVSLDVTNNFQCPESYLPVPASYEDTESFCVAKYEMKEDAQDGVVSEALGVLSKVIKPEAQVACQSLGDGNHGDYDLISNDEWQNLARNIEGVKNNWGDATVGSDKGLNRGHSTIEDDIDTAGLEASENDDHACSGLKVHDGSGYIDMDSSGVGECDSPWHSRKRTHKLSNDEVIWDVAGNLCEWVKEELKDTHVATITSNSYISQWTSTGGDENSYPLVYFEYDTSDNSVLSENEAVSRIPTNLFGPLGDYVNLNADPNTGSLTTNMSQLGDDMDPDSGSYYGNLGMAQFAVIATGRFYEICRGGNSGRTNEGVVAGIFSARMILKTSSESHAVRCVYHPKTRNPDWDSDTNPTTYPGRSPTSSE